ncbi:MAG: L-idonate 5-dehydrogenase [Microbacteriaceae bacterium]|nr:MAG: L-idonate 5-dehydrogenase [Microbacteriaceae bacterium]
MPMEITRIDAQQRAAVIYGPGQLRVESRPVLMPHPGEALVAIRTVGICGSDLGYLRGSSKYPVETPFVLGHEAAGVVAALGDPLEGRADHGIPVGTRVALVPGSSCGHCAQCRAGRDNLCSGVRYLGSAATNPPVDGALQSYLCLPVEQLLPIPDDVSYATAALLEPLGVAEHAVRRAEVADRSVLITGGGAIGQLLALVARSAGALEVTVCEVQERRRRLALDHGATSVVTPAEIDKRIMHEDRFDVVFDATGNVAAVELCIRAAKPGTGRVVVVGNLPSGTGFSPELVARAEIWLSATFRFPGGLERALSLITGGLDVEWLVESTAGIERVGEVLAVSELGDPPIKIQFTSNHAERWRMSAD